MKLEDFFKKKDQPVMVDPSFFPEQGEIKMDVVKGGVPIKTSKPVPVGGKVTIPTPGIGIETPASEKVPEETVKQIQRDFSTLAPPSEPQKPVDSMGLGDIRKVTSQSGITDTDLLVGLVPLLTSVIAGGRQGEGVDVSGKYYTDLATSDLKRRQTLEDKLLDLQKKKSKDSSSSRRFQTKNIVDNETKEIITVNYDTTTGQFFSPDGRLLSADKIRTGFSVIPEEYNRRTELRTEKQKELGEYFGRGTRISPNTGELVRVQDGKEVPIEPATQTKLNPKQEKDLGKITDKFLTTEFYKKTSQTLATSNNVQQLLLAANSGNAAAANSARVQIARMAGEVGALSDSDIERAGGSPALKERAKRYSQLQKSGVPLSERDMKELGEIANIYRKAASQKLNSAVQALEEDFVQNYGGVRGVVGVKMKPYIPSTSSEFEVKSKATTVQRKGPDGKVYTYTLNPKTGKYE